MTENIVASAGLQDIPMSSIKEMLQDIQARSHRDYDAEYGYHAETGELVIHFFPAGYAAGADTDWPSWEGFRDRLEFAIMGAFDVKQVKADYVPELKSFYVITPRPLVPDPTAFISRFFSFLEAGSETA